MARRKIFTGTFGPGPHRTHARPRGHTICDNGPRHAAECGLTTPGQLCKSQPGHVAFLLSGKLVIKQLNGALRRRALFTPLPLHVRCKGLSETKARAQQGQEAWQVLKFVRRESLDPQNQSSQPFLRLRCTPSRCGTVGQTLQGFRGLGSGPQGLLSFRRFELFSGFPDLCKSPPPTASVSQRESREFLRTAQLVEQSPWKLHRTAEYLQTPVSHDADGSSHTWKVLAIRWIFEEARAGGCPLER